jgi:5'-methylthioadenosine phosphorylase
MQNKKTILGIIGGSGVYQLDGLSQQVWKKIGSPFGDPSDELLFGEYAGQQLVFLPRHGRGHRYSPSDINYRANIDAMKRAGVTDIISVSAVGSLREELKPGTFVIVDQYIDRTTKRHGSFFGTGLVAHVSMAHPVCSRLGNLLEASAKKLNLEVFRGGTYVAMEGPQFSSMAESELYRSWNCDVIGMTNMPEAKLAREAEICYASVAMVTDYDCWHPNHDNVTVDAIIRVLSENASNARALIGDVAPNVSGDDLSMNCSCKFSLEHALLTNQESRDPQLIKMLDAVAARVL